MFAGLLSGIVPYFMGAFLLITTAFGGYALYERSEAADARASSATLSATVNEQGATLALNAKTLVDLQHMREIDEAVIVDQSNRSAVVQASLSKAEVKVSHVKVTDCQTPDARDLAALDGLRNIVAASSAVDSNGANQGTPAGVPAGISTKP